MERNNEKKQNCFSKIISRIYVSMKENAINSNLLFFISCIFELTGFIIVIDIIFNYKRDFRNIYYFIYYISPIFYFEILNCKFSNKNNPEEVNPSRYKYDQIYNLAKEFDIIPIEQKDFYNYNIVCMIIILFIITIFSIHLIRIENFIIRILKKISFYIIYLIYITFCPILILIFNRTIFLQFSDNYYEMDNEFILNVIICIIFNISLYYFYSVFIFCFNQNERFYFLQSKLFLFEFSLSEFGCFLIVIRLNIQFSILYQLLWSMIFIYDFKNRAESYRNELHKSIDTKILFLLRILIFGIFIVRFISVCLIKYLIDNVKLFKILEGILIVLTVIILFFYLNRNNKCVTLSKLKYDLQNESFEFFVGANQLFSPLSKFFTMKSNINRALEKSKEFFFINYQEDLRNYFCISDEDYKVLSGGNDSLISSFVNFESNHNKRRTTSTTINNEEKDYNIILIILSELFTSLYKIAKKKNDNYGINCLEILIYHKILLYWISDDKLFRPVYYLKKFVYSEKYDKSNTLIHSIFKYLSFHFKRVEKKNDENSLEYLVYFNKLNIEYLKILKSFKKILKSFSKSRKEIIRVIDSQSSEIGNSLNKIISFMDKTNDSIKIREQPENEKYKLIEDILFNVNFDKSLDFFDLNSLDTIVDKNNYFLILFEKGKFIVKKAPLTYFELTGNKTSKLIDNPSINIFPYLMRKSESKNIKSTLLSKKTMKQETVLETSEHYLVSVKLNYNILPSYNGKVCIVCLIETFDFPDDCNYVLMQLNGICLEYGIFFKNYLGFTNQLKRLNILTIFGIKDFNPRKANNQLFSINMNEFLLNVKTHLIKEGGFQTREINSCLKKIKENLKNSKIIKVEFILKRIFKLKNEEIFLMQIIFSDLKLSIIQQKNNENESIESGDIQTPVKGTSMTASHPGTSLLSYKTLRESSWNVTNKKKVNSTMIKTKIDRISFVYNLFLILLAIMICFLIQIFSNQFYNEYIKMLVIRELNICYFINLFFVSNMIKLPYSESIYDSLNEKYAISIENYNISLSDYYKSLLESYSVSLSIKNKYFKNNYTNIKKKSNFYKQIFQTNFTILLHDGNTQQVSYDEAFELPKNYFYILSQNEGFYLDMPFVNYNDIPYSIRYLNENQQYLLCSVYNFFSFVLSLNQILVMSKQRFKKELDIYNILMYFIFLGFLIFNFFSIILLYLSIEITNKKIYNITEQIIKLTKKGKNYLEEKLKYTKLIILNEIKCSSALEKIKEISPNNKIKASSAQNQIMMNSSGQNTEINPKVDDRDDEDMFLVKYNYSNKQKKYYFKTYCETIKILFILGMVYIIFLSIGFPIIINFFNRINFKRKETETIQDLQEIILGYYLQIRLGIFVNDTSLEKNIDVFGYATNALFTNFTEIKKLLTKENLKSINEYMEMVNSNGYEGCENIIENDKFYYSLVAICSIEPLLQTKVETMISGYVNQLRSEFLSFNKSERSQYDTILTFHSQTFQFNNLLFLIYFKNYFQDLAYNYILLELQNNINGLLHFLIIVFIIMVITEIIYYIGSNIFVLRKIASTLNDFKVLEKFFIYEDTKKK